MNNPDDLAALLVLPFWASKMVAKRMFLFMSRFPPLPAGRQVRRDDKREILKQVQDDGFGVQDDGFGVQDDTFWLFNPASELECSKPHRANCVLFFRSLDRALELECIAFIKSPLRSPLFVRARAVR